jgi:hypothetical protein
MSTENEQLTREAIGILFTLFALCCVASFIEKLLAGEIYPMLAAVSIVAEAFALCFFKKWI